MNQNSSRPSWLLNGSSYRSQKLLTAKALQILCICTAMVLCLGSRFASATPMVAQALPVAFSSNTPTQQGKQPNKRCQILILGDSLSAAYGLRVEQGWVNLLQQQLNQNISTKHCSVINASISGETTSGGLTRLPALLNQHQPTVLVLQLGANDGLRGLPIRNMEQNLSTMIKAAQQENTKVLLVGMQIPPNYGPNYAAQFSQSYTSLERKLNVMLVPFLLQDFAENPNAFQSDGIHPNASAQKQMLNNVWKGLAPLLK